MDPKPSVRDRIFKAALERIKHYGYGKTTMAEIAADCGMSPGNIYRFFEAKIDIAEAIARQHASEQHARMAAVARRKDLPPDQRLREVLLLRMHENFEALASDPKVLEMAAVVHRERPIIADEEHAHESVFLSQILREGMESGLFETGDVDALTESIQVATMKFAYPQFFSKLPLATLEHEFDGVMNLILQGIMKKEPAPAA